jgi:molybdopterin-binding protein
VRVDIGGGVIVTSSITSEAVDEPRLAADQVVFVVIKASNMMIGIA